MKRKILITAIIVSVALALSGCGTSAQDKELVTYFN